MEGRGLFDKLDRRDVSVLLMSLLLAFGIWLIHNLTIYYSEPVKVKIELKSNINGHSALSANSSYVTARCRATGFEIIRMRRRQDNVVRTLEIPSEELHYAGADKYYLTASELNRYAPDIFGDKAKPETFISDTVIFRFPFENNKKVPVVANASFSYKDQYMPSQELRLSPDSVVVYGQPQYLENIETIETEAFSAGELSSPLHGSVKLKKPSAGIRVSTEEVDYFLDVTRYVDVQTTLPVNLRNVPSGKDLLVFPSSINVTLRCAFPVIGDPLAGLSFYIDYKDFASSLSGKCMPKAGKIPAGVLDYELAPSVFDCIESIR